MFKSEDVGGLIDRVESGPDEWRYEGDFELCVQEENKDETDAEPDESNDERATGVMNAMPLCGDQANAVCKYGTLPLFTKLGFSLSQCNHLGYLMKTDSR